MNKITLLLLLNILVNPSYAFLCPHNMNSVEKGSTVEQVIQQCGPPETQKEYQQTLEQPVLEKTTTPIVVSNQSYKGPTQKIIVTTKLFYGPPNPAIFIFEDRKLIDKEIEH